MIGRGLLQRPTLAREFREGKTADEATVRDCVLSIHSEVLDHYMKTLEGGNGQILQKILPFWEYMEPVFGHKFVKAIRKVHTLEQYISLTR